MTTQQTPKLSREDGQLVDLVRSALTDPDIHTDRRMRLQDEISKILRAAHDETYGELGDHTHETRLAAHEQHLPSVLEAVLVDPKLDTTRRMRIHREISEAVAARRPAS